MLKTTHRNQWDIMKILITYHFNLSELFTVVVTYGIIIIIIYESFSIS